MHIDWSAIPGAVVASVVVVGAIGGLALRPMRKTQEDRRLDCATLYGKVAELGTRVSVLDSQYGGMEKKIDELKELIKELSVDVKEIARNRQA